LAAAKGKVSSGRTGRNSNLTIDRSKARTLVRLIGSRIEFITISRLGSIPQLAIQVILRQKVKNTPKLDFEHGKLKDEAE